jgi:hypothetical protein
MDCQTDVPRVGESRPAGVDSDSHSHHEGVAPAPFAERTLNGHGRPDGVSGALEDCEEFVRPCVDLPSARLRH